MTDHAEILMSLKEGEAVMLPSFLSRIAPNEQVFARVTSVGRERTYFESSLFDIDLGMLAIKRRGSKGKRNKPFEDEPDSPVPEQYPPGNFLYEGVSSLTDTLLFMAADAFGTSLYQRHKDKGTWGKAHYKVNVGPWELDIRTPIISDFVDGAQIGFIARIRHNLWAYLWAYYDDGNGIKMRILFFDGKAAGYRASKMADAATGYLPMTYLAFREHVKAVFKYDDGAHTPSMKYKWEPMDVADLEREIGEQSDAGAWVGDPAPLGLDS